LETEAARAVEDTKIDGATTLGTAPENLRNHPLRELNTFNQFEDLKVDNEDIETVGSNLHVKVPAATSAATDSTDSRSRATAIRSVDSRDIEISLESPAFEVGQGCSPAKLCEFFATVDRHYEGQEESGEMTFSEASLFV
jgi:hypothetical protein